MLERCTVRRISSSDRGRTDGSSLDRPLQTGRPWPPLHRGELQPRIVSAGIEPTAAACSGRSVRLAADQLLERGFVADRIEVRVVLCGIAELLRHLDGVPEVIERVTRPAALTLTAGEVEEQHGVLRNGCDQGAQTVGDLRAPGKGVSAPSSAIVTGGSILVSWYDDSCINHRSSNQESPPPHQVLPCHENTAATRPFRATRKYPPKGSSSPCVPRPIRRLPRKHLGRVL